MGRRGLWPSIPYMAACGLVSGQEGVVHFVDGQVRASYSARDGLGKGSVSQLRRRYGWDSVGRDRERLKRIKAGRIATLNRRAGYPAMRWHSMIHDDDGASWVHTECGLVRIAKSDLDTWGAGVDHGNAPPRVPATVLDSSDGVLSATLSTFSPSATRSRDGKLWFASYGGVEVVDPRQLPLNKLPPPVHVEQITADRKTYDTSSDVNGYLRLPPLIRDLEIDYTALSLGRAGEESVSLQARRSRSRLAGRRHSPREPSTRSSAR